MGVTLSHATLAPISMASLIIGFISFAFTLATFLNVFWNSLITIKSAPSEISDYLSSLKVGLIEERRHLRKVRKRIRSARPANGGGSGSDGAGWGGGGNVYGNMHPGKRKHSRGRKGRKGSGGAASMRHVPAHFERDVQAFQSQGETDSLRVMRTSIRDMIRLFRTVEYPFLRPEFQNTDGAHWSTNTPVEKRNPNFTQSPPRHQHWDDEGSEADLGHTNRFGSEYRNCGLRERWLWLRRKPGVVNMLESLSRIETRRMSHELGMMFTAVGDIGRDVEDMRGAVLGMEGRLNRVVGIRRVD